eukprot:Unigene719_Nuclearia_a/m.2313 Unigene719_Nuclearia_a/g.2313  ORF Unigene719_Nuclearia_a/g.2313 Unigene719_Nuclearia_a/m.2313 type:complete len:221 (-) Unigene719_Nuclearia_a:1937-2599(-)
MAGTALCRSLSMWTVRLCDPEQTVQRDDSAVRALAMVMPFLLQKGVLSDAEDVRHFLLATITKLCRRSGHLLAPYAADTIVLLVEALSSLEPQAVNYLTFHVDKYDISRDELDQSRLAATRSSPVMEAIEACLDNKCLLPESIEQMMPRLLAVVRKGVGFPRKAIEARVCLLLAEHHPAATGPHAAAMLQALSGAVQDRSSSLLRKVMAATAARVAGVAP